MAILPGGPIATRPLHFIWILDCSGSMAGDKIAQLNFAIKESIPAMQDAARDNANAQVLVRVATFSNGAKWHTATPVDVHQFKWVDASTETVTDMGKALILVAEQLRMPPMPERALPPVLVLVSDGQPTDDYESGLRAILAEQWGRRAVRLAIAIGHDADQDVLNNFIGNPEMPCLVANNADTLVKYVRWASTAVVKAASAPAGGPPGVTPPGGPVPIPAPPPAANAADVW
jgi:uncharacterized protein YegL